MARRFKSEIEAERRKVTSCNRVIEYQPVVIAALRACGQNEIADMDARLVEAYQRDARKHDEELMRSQRNR